MKKKWDVTSWRPLPCWVRSHGRHRNKDVGFVCWVGDRTGNCFFIPGFSRPLCPRALLRVVCLLVLRFITGVAANWTELLISRRAANWTGLHRNATHKVQTGSKHFQFTAKLASYWNHHQPFKTSRATNFYAFSTPCICSSFTQRLSRKAFTQPFKAHAKGVHSLRKNVSRCIMGDF